MAYSLEQIDSLRLSTVSFLPYLPILPSTPSKLSGSASISEIPSGKSGVAPWRRCWAEIQISNLVRRLIVQPIELRRFR